MIKLSFIVSTADPHCKVHVCQKNEVFYMHVHSGQYHFD